MCTSTECTFSVVCELAWWWLDEPQHVARFINNYLLCSDWIEWFWYFAHYALTPCPVLLQMYASSFNPHPSFCSDSPKYPLHGGLSITTLLGASRRFWKRRVWLRSDLRRRCLVEVRNLNDTIQRCQNCLSYDLTLFLFMNSLQNATLAPSLSRLLSFFVFMSSPRIIFLRSW